MDQLDGALGDHGQFSMDGSPNSHIVGQFYKQALCQSSGLLRGHPPVLVATATVATSSGSKVESNGRWQQRS